MSMYDKQGYLTNNWYAIAKASEIKKNKPVKRTVMEIPLVCWRNEQGEIQILMDRCIHRNAPLSEGQIVNNCLVCPYHGWTFNETGSCVKIPSEGPHNERIPKQKVEKFPAMERYELVWVWMGRETVPSKEPFEMPLIKGQGWKHYYMVTEFDNNVTDLVENFMDVPHTVYVHEGWFRDRKQMCVKADVERTNDSVLVTYDQPNDSIGFFGKLLNPKGLPMTHTDNFYMPNITRVDYSFGEKTFIITSTCTPISEFKSIVYTLITYNFGWLNPAAKFFMPWYTKKVIDQDVWIMEKQGNNLKTFQGEKVYRSSQADTMHVYIESLRKHAIKGNGAVPPRALKKEMEFWI